MKTADGIRQSVSEAYASAITGQEGAACRSCGPQSTAFAELVGYRSEDLNAVPAEAASQSFGCGNPLAYSEVKEGDVVLDLGSGAGFDLLLASSRVGPTGRVIGVDMTDAMIETARKNIAAAGADNVEVRKGIIEDLPVDPASVDWVVSNCVVNLSPEKAKVFSEIVRVLKPGGRLLISDIVVEDLSPELRANAFLYNSCVAGAIPEAEYLEGLRIAGLQDVEVVARLHYGREQIRSFIETDHVPDLEQAFRIDTEESKETLVQRFLDEVTGKVWSAKFSARKPQH